MVPTAVHVKVEASAGKAVKPGYSLPAPRPRIDGIVTYKSSHTYSDVLSAVVSCRVGIPL